MVIYGKQEVYKIGVMIQAAADETVRYREAVKITKGQLYCNRCGSHFSLREVRLPAGSYYCPGCVLYGRLTDQDQLVSIHRKEEAEVLQTKPQIHCRWLGELTRQQSRLAEELIRCVDSRENVLLWAVTGAGKTEMLYPLIENALNEGKQIAIASPRIDVCRELYPRLVAAFPDVAILLRYGKALEQWQEFDLLVCTTHQLLHFYQAFDLLVVDESDAFPYEGDPLLAFGTTQALKPMGVRVCLTATPTKNLLQKAKSENWQVLHLPQRYHRRPLVVPELFFLEDWRNLAKYPLRLARVLRICEQLLKENQVLFFCPDIAFMKDITKVLQEKLPQKKITFVSAQDPLREEKILQLRNKQWDILLCTTILERGVTFERVSVVVMGAEHEVFNKSVLVQIAGRVDRKGTQRNGRVLFFFQEQTLAIRKAIKEIIQMNQLAKKEAKR